MGFHTWRIDSARGGEAATIGALGARCEQPVRVQHRCRGGAGGAGPRVQPSGRPTPPPTSTPRRHGPSTTATRSGRASTRPVSASPRPNPPGSRRCSTARSTGSRSRPRAASTWPPRTTPSTPWRPTPGSSSGRPTWGRRCRPRPTRTSRAATSSRCRASPGRGHRHRPRRDLSRLPTNWSTARRPTSWWGWTCTPAPRSCTPVPVDPPDGSDNPPANLLQRTGLNLDNGNVVFGFGAIPGTAPVPRLDRLGARRGGGPGFFDTTPDGVEGAVWMGGAAPEVDGAGNIWFATATARGRRTTTAATRSSSCRRRWGWSSGSTRATGRTTIRTIATSDRLRPRCSRTGRCCRWASPRPASCSTSPPSTAGQRDHLGADLSRQRRRRWERGRGNDRVRGLLQRAAGHSDQPLGQRALDGGQRQPRDRIIAGGLVCRSDRARWTE